MKSKKTELGKAITEKERELKEIKSHVCKLQSIRKDVEERVSSGWAREFPEIPIGEKQREIQELRLRERLKEVLREELTKTRKLVKAEIERVKLDKAKFADDKKLDDLITIYSSVPETASSTPLYKCIEGEESKIRLVTILPAPNQYFPLVCELRADTLISNHQPPPECIALSYWWGPPTCKTIYIVPQGRVLSSYDRMGTDVVHQTVPMDIRSNLFCALHRLRRPDKKVTVWVDRLCINQSDDEEKTQQLNEMMVDIYRKAQKVCVWLDESDDAGQSDMGMDFIPKIVERATLNDCISDESLAAQWLALNYVTRDPWFSRRWVIQEIVLAKEATLHCGQLRVTWTDFVDAMFLLVTNEERVRKQFDYSKWRDGPDTLVEIQRTSANMLLQIINHLFLRNDEGTFSIPGKSLEYLITSLTTFDTSDERDIIYSLAQIAADSASTKAFPDMRTGNSGREPRAQETRLRIDYKKQIYEVYRDFTSFCIQSSNSLDIICRHWALKDSTGNSPPPTWIPLLDNSEFGKPDEENRGRKNGESLVGRAGQARYDASKGRGPKVDFQLGEPSVLPAEGFVLAKIVNLSPVNRSGFVFKESLKMTGWRGICRSKSESMSDSVPDSVWRTLIADRDLNGQVPPTWYHRVCFRCLEMADKFNSGNLNIGQLEHKVSNMVRIYLTKVRNVIWNRRVFHATFDKDEQEHGPAARSDEPNGDDIDRRRQGPTRRAS